MTVEQARGAASAMNGKLANGENPFEDRALTFGTIYERYITEHLASNAKNPSAAMAAARIAAKRLASWSNRPLNQLERGHITTMHARLKNDYGLWTANRTLQALKAAINWAIEEEIFTGPNPATGIKIFKEPSRDRYLQPDELPRLFAALEDPRTAGDLRDYVLLSLYTGARRNDLLSMRWQDIQQIVTAAGEGEQFWRVPDPKNSKPYNIPLIPQALVVLARRKRRHGKSPWVFPSATSRSGHFTEPKTAWTTLRRRAGLKDVRLHDLRRTLGSWQAGQGTSLLIIGKSLGHKSTAATEIYSRLNLDPIRTSVRAAVEAMQATREIPNQLTSGD
jgi:integrase